MQATGKIVALRPRESAVVPRETQAMLNSAALAEAMEDLALALARCCTSYRAGHPDLLARHAQGALDLSRRLRLERLSRVIASVIVLSGRLDETALAAAMSRLGRLGDATLAALWHLQDRAP